ncbi:DUF2479 domain-containing protein [Paraclostridium sordellii 8483]|uniref:gp53-like domain-containing protein n=1 Tax=Paraclostridium sordellii TaxID=1505 RepID=UPI0002FCF152|nr:BppU family phage baseplate upper protein [Paeniclostridium sordellii]TAN66612.1 DUF2479 domain-containing protein [Paeniclostridium sordellii 8483]
MRNKVYLVDINKKQYQTAWYKQYDNDIPYTIRLVDDGVDVNLSGYNISAFFKNKVGNVFEKSCTIQEESLIKTTLDNNILGVDGDVNVEFALERNSQIVTTFTITFKVEKSINRNEALTEQPQWDIIKDLFNLEEILNNKIDEINTFVSKKNTEIQNTIKKANSKIDEAIKNIPPGPQGPEGPPGRGLNILGSFNSESELPSNPSQGDGYLVNSSLFISIDNEWVNCGPIQGPIGPTGPPGPAGKNGAQGKQGPPGQPGVNGKDAVLEEHFASNGWIKFSDGLILQWGLALPTPNAFAPIKFPISFPIKCYCMVPQFVYGIGRKIAVDDLTSSGFSFKVEDAGSAGEVRWFAIGH